MDDRLTLDDVLNAYRLGLFPMADSREAEEFYWYDPPSRGQLSIPGLRISSRLRRTVLRFPYEIRIDSDFAGVIDGCAAEGRGRAQTWINRGIRDLFVALHESGHAHSVEAWSGGVLAGGLYGLAVGGAFMGESMFSRARDASKIALVHLCARLQAGGFTVLDTQLVNPHLEQFGVYEIPRADYLARLRAAQRVAADFIPPSGPDERTLVKAYLKDRKGFGEEA